MSVEDFLIDGREINPKCVNLLQTWPSESTSIIVRSVILEPCQDSELAYEGQGFTKSEDGMILYCEDPEDRHSCFSYRALGRTSRGLLLF